MMHAAGIDINQTSRTLFPNLRVLPKANPYAVPFLHDVDLLHAILLSDTKNGDSDKRPKVERCC